MLWATKLGEEPILIPESHRGSVIEAVYRHPRSILLPSLYYFASREEYQAQQAKRAKRAADQGRKKQRRKLARKKKRESKERWSDQGILRAHVQEHQGEREKYQENRWMLPPCPTVKAPPSPEKTEPATTGGRFGGGGGYGGSAPEGFGHWTEDPDVQENAGLLLQLEQSIHLRKSSFYVHKNTDRDLLNDLAISP
jgi:hypothetical protein